MSNSFQTQMETLVTHPQEPLVPLAQQGWMEPQGVLGPMGILEVLVEQEARDQMGQLGLQVSSNIDVCRNKMAIQL